MVLETCVSLAPLQSTGRRCLSLSVSCFDEVRGHNCRLKRDIVAVLKRCCTLQCKFEAQGVQCVIFRSLAVC